MGRAKDLTGQRFGRLTVIKRVENDKNRNSQWLCKCDCGNEIIAKAHLLKNKETQSCGCLQKEKASSTLSKLNKIYKKKYNTYDLSGEYGIGYTSKGEEFYFDLEDYDLIKDYCWHINDDGYIASYNGAKLIKMHKLLFPESDYVDHKHGDKTKNDNRKSNLRPCTSSQNNINRKKFSNNKSGVVGVSWYKSINKWIAYITYNKKRINLGTFENFEDAVKARKEAEEKYFGEWSYDNSRNAINGGC